MKRIVISVIILLLALQGSQTCAFYGLRHWLRAKAAGLLRYTVSIHA